MLAAGQGRPSHPRLPARRRAVRQETASEKMFTEFYDDKNTTGSVKKNLFMSSPGTWI